MQQCDHCPVKRHCPDSDLTCRAIARNHPRYCDLVNPEHHSYNEDYVYSLCQEVKPAPVVVSMPPPDPALMSDVYACPYRSRYVASGDTTVHVFGDGSPAEGCGCGKSRCQLGKGDDGKVGIEDCKVCILAQREAPGFLVKVANFAGAVGRFMRSGGETVSDEEKERRLSICKSCSQNHGGSCLKCGCILAIKCGMATESCPLDPPKWGAPPAPVPEPQAHQ